MGWHVRRLDGSARSSIARTVSAAIEPFHNASAWDPRLQRSSWLTHLRPQGRLWYHSQIRHLDEAPRVPREGRGNWLHQVPLKRSHEASSRTPPENHGHSIRAELKK